MTRTDLLIALSALAIIAAVLLSGCVSGPVTVHVNARVNVDSNLVSALSVALGCTNNMSAAPSPVVAGALTLVAEALGLPVPSVVGTAGAGLLSIVAVVVGMFIRKRKQKEAKREVANRPA